MKKRNFLAIILCWVLLLQPNVFALRAQAEEAVISKIMSFDGGDDPSFQLYGGTIVEGVDGSNAVRLQNGSGTATQYVDLGEFDVGTRSFSVSFWYNISEEQVMQSEYCALLSNKDWAAVINPGFMIAMYGEPGTYKGLWIDFSAQGNSGRYYLSGQKNTDGRWHAATVVFDRTAKTTTYYCDGEATGSFTFDFGTDGSASTGLHLYLGCDGKKNYGCLDTSFDEIRVYDGALSAEGAREDAMRLLAYRSAQELKETYDNYLSGGAVNAAMAEKYYEVSAQTQELLDSGDLEGAYERAHRAFGEVFGMQNGEVLTSFNVVSDVHIDGAPEETYPVVKVYKDKLKRAMNSFNQLFPQTETLVLPGDFTKNGKGMDFDAFFKELNILNRHDNVLIALGNHEVKYSAAYTYDDVKEIFLEKMSRYGLDGEEIYYDRWIDGYHFIVLSTEEMEQKGGGAYLSDAQLQFLREKLAENAMPGKPAFVILHQPLADTFPLSSKYPVGEQDAQIKEILKEYPGTFLISGHLHNGYLDERALVQNEYGVQFDCSALWQNELANQNGDYAYHVDVYADRVQILAVDTLHGEIDYRYTKIVPLSTLGAQADFADLPALRYTDAAGAEISLDETVYIVESDAQDWNAHAITLELEETKKVCGIRYLGGETGRVTAFDLEYSADGKTWKGIAGLKEFVGSDGYKVFRFAEVMAKYLRFVPLSSTLLTGDSFVTSVAELHAMGGV